MAAACRSSIAVGPKLDRIEEAIVSHTIFTPEEQQAIESNGFLLRMVCLPGFWISAIAVFLSWHSQHWLLAAGWTLVASYTLFCWTSCFHETAHQTLTRWRRVDVAIGRFLGTAMCVSYTAYRESHIRHHAYMNRPNDWELWPYSDPSCSRTFRRLFVLLDVCAGPITAPFVYGRIYLHKNSPLKDVTLRRTMALEYLAIAIFWGSIYAAVAATGSWADFARIWLVPLTIAGFFQTMRKLTEHLGMSSYDPLLGTRTVISDNWITRFCSYANFDIFIHGPHHRHPRLSQNRLRRKMDEYRSANPDVAYPVYSSYLRATLAMLPCFFRNPGIGVNAGADAVSGRDQWHGVDVTNFPSDVLCDEAVSSTTARQFIDPPHRTPAPVPAGRIREHRDHRSGSIGST